MIAATKKWIFIVTILSIVSNEANSSIMETAIEKMKALVPAAIRKFISQMTNSGPEFLKDNDTLNCLGLSTKFFAKAIDALLTDVTKSKDVKFYFSSNKQRNHTTVTILNDQFTLNNTNFDFGLNTVLITHGFMSSGKEKWLKDLKNALLDFEDMNVIIVDWQRGSNTWNYLAAATSTKIVGAQVAKLFALMRDEASRQQIKEFGEIHFIGHSLGAHIVARAAHLIKESQKQKKSKKAWIVNRITGLDPAQPCFTTADEDLKLDENDAKYVDVIHTNARYLRFLGLGLPARIGYVDFYPNGGQIQPGCADIETHIWSILTLPKKVIQASVCSHGRSHQFFIESVNDLRNESCRFVSHRWDHQYNNFTGNLLEQTCPEGRCPHMGLPAIASFPKTKGIFFTPTGHAKPYCVVKENDKVLIEEQLGHDAALANFMDITKGMPIGK